MAAVIADPQLAEKYASSNAYPEDEAFIQSARNPGEAAFFKEIVARSHDPNATLADHLYKNMEAVIRLHRYEQGRRTEALPNIAFEPEGVTIQFASREDLLYSVSRLIDWLNRSSDEEYYAMVGR